MKNSLLARFAENIFWLARYMERAENLARIIDVTETHARDAEGNQNWQAILEMNADLDRFKKLHGDITDRNVIYFYVLSRDNPTSILSSVTSARENARSLRHLISTEMWSQINMFQAWLGGLQRRDIMAKKLVGVCGHIKEACQTHTGITEGTLYQDQGWCFYWMGKSVERLDQASRLIDIGYRQALLSGKDIAAQELESHWNGLLRSASGYQAFRRTHRIHLRPQEVIQFLLLDSDFPRSPMACTEATRYQLRRLEDRFGVESGRQALVILDDLRAHFLATDLPEVLAADFHAYIDNLQRRLAQFTNALGQGCFGLPS
ncbi:alpha-E domain-containing protein [Magnetospira thiophila]